MKLIRDIKKSFISGLRQGMSVLSVLRHIILMLTAIGCTVGAIFAVFEPLRLLMKPTDIQEITPGKRIQSSIEKLSSASREIDTLFQEIATNLRNRERALNELESKNEKLAAKEEVLTKRINDLKDMPPVVAEYFQQITMQSLKQMERRSTTRDIIMNVIIFVLGIFSTLVITVLYNRSKPKKVDEHK